MWGAPSSRLLDLLSEPCAESSVVVLVDAGYLEPNQVVPLKVDVGIRRDIRADRDQVEVAPVNPSEWRSATSCI